MLMMRLDSEDQIFTNRAISIISLCIQIRKKSDPIEVGTGDHLVYRSIFSPRAAKVTENF